MGIMGIMTLLAKQKWRHRGGEQMYEYQQGKEWGGKY